MLGVVLVVLSACLYGSGPFFARIAYDAGMSPLPLLTWRYCFAAIVGWLLLAATASGRHSLRRLTGRYLVVLVCLGFLFMGNAGSYTAALQTVPASLVAIITYLYPALVAVLSVRYARRLEGRRPWVALGLSTLGVALAVGGIPADADIPLTGLLLSLSCAICYAVWIVLAARLRGERPDTAPEAADRLAVGPEDTAATTQGPEALVSSAIISTTTVATGALLTLLLGGDPSPAAVPGEAWPAIVGFGVFSGVAVVAFLVGTRRIGAARAALVSTIEPVYTIVLATLLLGETLGPVQVVGGALVVIGVLLAETGGTGRADQDDARAPTDPGTSEAAALVTADRATV